MKGIFFAGLVLIIFCSCKTQRKTIADVAPVEDTLTDNSHRKLLRDKEIFSSVTEVVPLDTVFIRKDTLHLLTKKILGCDTENFKLFWNGTVLKSLPPQANVKLFQQVNADCKERHVFHLTYNISPLRLKNDSLSVSNESLWSKVTVVKVGGWKNILKYEF